VLSQTPRTADVFVIHTETPLHWQFIAAQLAKRTDLTMNLHRFKWLLNCRTSANRHGNSSNVAKFALPALVSA